MKIPLQELLPQKAASNECAYDSRNPKVRGNIGTLRKGDDGRQMISLHDYYGGHVYRIPLNRARYMDNRQLSDYYGRGDGQPIPRHELVRRCAEVRATWSKEQANYNTCNSSLEPVL